MGIRVTACHVLSVDAHTEEVSVYLYPCPGALSLPATFMGMNKLTLNSSTDSSTELFLQSAPLTHPEGDEGSASQQAASESHPKTSPKT
jgi:hypothetical protein